MCTLKNDDGELTKLAHTYAGTYNIRNEKIAEIMEIERGTKPLLWIVLTLIFTPISSAFLAFLGNSLGPSLMELLPKVAILPP